ncbi:Pro-Pol polyprotein [Dictyocoela muelleri]|nr:Pro-Pol polyprotein [Dictyocoela muelleri]
MCHFEAQRRFSSFYILVISEFLSKYTEVVILTDINSRSVAKAFEKNYLTKYITPKYCRTDNGRQFTADNFKQLLKKYNISHILTSLYNLTGNATVERINKEIGMTLRLSRNTSLANLKWNIWRRVNLTIKRTTGHSPWCVFVCEEQKNKYRTRKCIEVNEIKARIKKQMMTNVKKSNSKCKKVEFKIGDLVLKKSLDQDKVTTRYKEPFKIIGIGELNNTVVIDEGIRQCKVSIRNVKPFKWGDDVRLMLISHFKNDQNPKDYSEREIDRN